MLAGPELEAGSEFAGHRVEGIIGRGGMGVVYRAIDLRLRRTVALKLIAPELSRDSTFRTRFERESRTAAAIRHPHVITIFHAGEFDGSLFITMEYIEGTDLGAMVARGPLDLQLAATIVSQVGHALDAAHRRALIHRDVKPANILFATEDGAPHAYLTDFGLTKSISSESGVTGTGMLVGTVDYMAPEQAEGRPLDHRTDVYALGCVLYDALTGEVPYPREELVAKLYAKTHLPPPSVLDRRPDLPPELDMVIKKAMARRPDDRYSSALEFGDAVLAGAKSRAVRVRADDGIKAPASGGPQTGGPHAGRLPQRSARNAVPGWYPDPKDAGLQRYWDGTAWTHWTHPLASTPSPALWPKNLRRFSLWWVWACIPWLTPVAWLHAYCVTAAKRHLPFLALYAVPLVIAGITGEDRAGHLATSATALVAVTWIVGGLHAWRIARSVNQEFLARRLGTRKVSA